MSIMAYTAKYASAFYGPFRDALASAPAASAPLWLDCRQLSSQRQCEMKLLSRIGHCWQARGRFRVALASAPAASTFLSCSDFGTDAASWLAQHSVRSAALPRASQTCPSWRTRPSTPVPSAGPSGTHLRLCLLPVPTVAALTTAGLASETGCLQEWDTPGLPGKTLVPEYALLCPCCQCAPAPLCHGLHSSAMMPAIPMQCWQAADENEGASRGPPSRSNKALELQARAGSSQGTSAPTSRTQQMHGKP